MNDVSIGVGKLEDSEDVAVYISKIVKKTEQGCDVEIFDGEKWYPKTIRFENLPVVFTLTPKNVEYLKDCLGQL